MIFKKSLPSQTIPWLSESPGMTSSPCQWRAGLVPRSSQLTASLSFVTNLLSSLSWGRKCSDFLCDFSAADSGNLKGSLCYSLPHNDTNPILNLLINFEGKKTRAQFKNVNNPHDQMGWALMCPSLQMMLFIFNCSTYRLVSQQDKHTLGAWQCCLRCITVALGKLNIHRAHSFFSICQKGFRALGDILPCQLGVCGDAEASPHMRLCSSPCSRKNLKIFSLDSKFSLLITGRMVQISSLSAFPLTEMVVRDFQWLNAWTVLSQRV